MFNLKEESKVIIIYLIIGFSWIYFSDALLLELTTDINQFNQLQTYKGTFYVIFTAVIFFFLLKKYIGNLRDQKRKLKESNEQLTAYTEEVMAMNEELDQSFEEINNLNQRFVDMIDTVSSLEDNVAQDEDEFLGNLLLDAVNIVPEADYGKIYIIEDETCRFVSTVGHDIDILKELRINKKHLKNSDSEKIYYSQDYSIDIESLDSELQDKFADALKPIKESIYIDINVNNRKAGRISLDIAEGSTKTFKSTTPRILESFSTLASAFFAYKRYDYLQGKFTRELISSIIKILEMYDIYTKGHSENVANISLLLAEELNLSEEEVLDAYWAGMVHDIGKLLVPVEILNKKGSLNDVEYELVKNHPVWGSKALSDSETLEHISEYVLYHHERWDGGGYPNGLERGEIPIISQVISVADAWDAMTSNRAYRDSLSKEDAFNEIEKNRGTQFSPQVVDVFIKIYHNDKLESREIAAERISELDELKVAAEKNNYFEKLFEESNEGIVILDNNFKIRKANQSFLDMFSFSESDVRDVMIEELLAPAEKKEEFEENLQALREGREISTRTYRKIKNGDRMDVTVKAFPVKLSENEIRYYVIYRDVTELEMAKQKSENYRGRYRTIFENESTVMLIIDPLSGKIVDANPAAENFYGWSKEELIEMNINNINVLSEEEVKKEMEEAKSENKNHFVFKHRTFDENIKEVEVYSQPIDFGKRKLLYSIIHDISDKKPAKKSC